MALPTTYNINKSIQSTIGAYGAQFCKTIYTSTLGAGVEATLTVPGISALGNVNSSTSTQWLAVFSYQAAKDVWVALNGTAAVPAGNTLAASTSALNPPGKIVKQGDVIHMICAAAADVSVELYYLQEG